MNHREFRFLYLGIVIGMLVSIFIVSCGQVKADEYTFHADYSAVHNIGALQTGCKVTRFTEHMLQAYDGANSYRIQTTKPNRYEVGVPAKYFGRFNPFAAILSATMMDVISDALTRHSPVARCAADVYLASEAAHGIIYSNSWTRP